MNCFGTKVEDEFAWAVLATKHLHCASWEDEYGWDLDWVWSRVYFVLIEPALEQAFITFYALRVCRSVEQKFLPTSLVYVGIVEYYSRKTVSHHMFSWDAWFIYQPKEKKKMVAIVNKTK